MYVQDYLLYTSYYLILFVVKSEEHWEGSNNNFEKKLSSVFRNIFLSEELYAKSNISKDLGYYKRNKFVIQNNYLKGYSLKIPKRRKLFGNGSSPNMFPIEQEIRTKRGVGHLYNMISCATGCNPISYKGYGCFCGLFGAGNPVDGIDRCCKTHDWCYDAAKCPMYLEYFVPYYWKCWYNTPFCALDHGEFGPPGSCADKLCECDRTLSECLKRYSCPSRRAFCKSSPFRILQNAFMLLT